MKNRVFIRVIDSSIILLFISILLANFSNQSIDLDQHADNSDYNTPNLNQGEFVNTNKNAKLIRRKRTSSILQYLADRRKARNTTITLSIEMKFWLRIELRRRKETNQGDANNQNKDPDKTPQSEQPIELETTEGTPQPEVTTVKPNMTIVYKNKEFIELCNEPVFTSADSSLDGSEILIFKGNKFYVMENLRYGSGNLVASGVTSELFPKFDSKGFTSMSTIKEGSMRGYKFAFYDSPERAGWTPIGSAREKHVNEFPRKSLATLPKTGFQAVLHNRNISQPLMIGLNGEQVYYYKIENKTFTKVKEVSNQKSDEKFPPKITAAFSMPNGYVYLFKKEKYCVRELHYEVTKEGVYCDLWLDNKLFLGCYGQYPPPYSIEDDIENYSGLDLKEERDQLCDNLKNLKLDLSMDGLTVMAFNEDKYWSVEKFPEKPNISFKNSTADKWKAFETGVDAVLLVREGQHLRGNLFAFKKGKYSHWTTNGKQLEKNKKIEKFTAILQNSDILNPMAVAFDEKSLYYYSTESTALKLIKTVDYNKCEENWPKGITTALTINTDHIYLFKGDKYCLREWKCTDSTTHCCKKWLSAKELFQCS